GLAWAVGLLLVCNVAFASIIGKGEVKLSRGAVDYFIKYIIYSCIYVIKVYYISSYMVNFGY
ncbi:MAG: hypothetical protein QGH65_14605, partial [SAR324 cluster bacterium]|nr:hypothetical protein [SAR324 cluster bacterium]